MMKMEKEAQWCHFSIITRNGGHHFNTLDEEKDTEKVFYMKKKRKMENMIWKNDTNMARDHTRK